MSQSFDIRLYTEPAKFLAETRTFLLENEVLNNLQLGLPASIVAGRRYSDQTPVFLSAHQNNACLGTLVCTPPYNVSLSLMGASVCDSLAKWWIKHQGFPKGVGAESTVAHHFASFCHARVERSMDMRVFELLQVVPPPRVDGRMSKADGRHREQVRQWFDAFHREATPDLPADNPTDYLLDGGNIWLWEISEKMVSMAAVNRELPHGRCNGSVYTPPAERGRGYGTALTAALSEEILRRGKRYCCLFADLSNPTSNKIYQRIEYYPIGDFSQLSFAEINHEENNWGSSEGDTYFRKES